MNSKLPSPQTDLPGVLDGVKIGAQSIVLVLPGGLARRGTRSAGGAQQNK